MVCSALSTESLSRIDKIYEKILQGKGVTSIPGILVSTKNDCEDVSLTQENLKEAASRFGFVPLSLSLPTDTREDTIYPAIAQLLKDLRKSQANPIGVIGEADRTGELSKTNKSLRKFSPKTLVIQSGIIYITSDGVVTPKCKSMNLMNGSFEILPSDPARKIFPFELRCADKSLFLSASTESVRAAWIDTIILNIAYGSLANSVLEDIIKASLWEVSVELKTAIANGTETLQPIETATDKKDDKKKRGFSMFKKKPEKEKSDKPKEKSSSSSSSSSSDKSKDKKKK